MSQAGLPRPKAGGEASPPGRERGSAWGSVSQVSRPHGGRRAAPRCRHRARWNAALCRASSDRGGAAWAGWPCGSVLTEASRHTLLE